MHPLFKVLICLLAATAGSAIRLAAAPISGEAIYRERCASCHELVNPRIPRREALQKMSAARILRALDFGVMISVAYPLRREEREAVAAYLGTPGLDAGPPAKAYCAGRGGSLDGPGVVVAGGKVFVNSGYARNGGMPGNVLLAFSPEN